MSQALERTRKAAFHMHREVKQQQGMTLVELMIMLVLGLVILAAVLNIYSGSTRSARFTEGLQAMQENGRYGVSVLQRGARLAGYSATGYIDALDIGSSGPDTLVVRSEHDYDCNGTSTVATGGLAINTYRLDANTQQLTCQGNQTGSTAMPVVDNVEAFRVLYGVDEDGDSNTSEPQRYVTYDASIDVRDVVALRVALLVNSGSPIRNRNKSDTYVVLDQELTRDDRLMREVFSSTIKLRNRE